jgi:predicted outer membrane repeat protein
MKFFALAVFEGNTAISGGGILVADNSTVLVENSTFTANTAMSDGGGILCAHFSSTIISAHSEFRNNYAERGGAMFSNGASISLVAPVIVAGNVAEVDGGAIFMYATVYLQRSAVLAIDFENNTAKSRGGSIFASGAGAQLALSPDVEVSFQNNSASLHGGALYLEDAASMKVAEETCIATCQSQIRGDGVCNPACMTRGCNWDNGDCASLIANAAENSRTPCNRIDCPFSAQTVASASDGCYRFCFNSSCDWSRNLCQRTRNALANCPLFDLAAYESFLRPMFPPITYALGPSGAGRCINASDQCKASTRNDFKVTTPNTIVGDYAFDFQASWIYVPNTTELKSVQNASVEMWLKLHSNIALNGDWYLMSSPNMEIVLTNTPDLGKHISLRFRGVGPECYEAYSWPLFSSVWSHVAVVLASLGPNTSSTIMYLNGTLLPRIGGTCLAPPSIAWILGWVSNYLLFVWFFIDPSHMV